MTVAIVHSRIPAGPDGGFGGFDWAVMDTPAHDELSAQFALDSDTEHRDYQPSHVHRLVRVSIPDGLAGDDVTDYIEEHYLDGIESGIFDGKQSQIAMHNPTINTEGGQQ